MIIYKLNTYIKDLDLKDRCRYVNIKIGRLPPNQDHIMYWRDPKWPEYNDVFVVQQYNPNRFPDYFHFKLK